MFESFVEKKINFFESFMFCLKYKSFKDNSNILAYENQLFIYQKCKFLDEKEKKKKKILFAIQKIDSQKMIEVYHNFQ